MPTHLRTVWLSDIHLGTAARRDSWTSPMPARWPPPGLVGPAGAGCDADASLRAAERARVLADCWDDNRSASSNFESIGWWLEQTRMRVERPVVTRAMLPNSPTSDPPREFDTISRCRSRIPRS